MKYPLRVPNVLKLGRDLLYLVSRSAIGWALDGQQVVGKILKFI